MRGKVFMVCGMALCAGLLTGTANAAPATNSWCPSGYEPVTLEQLLTTDEVVAAAADRIYFADHVEEVFSALDQNHDGLVCYKPVANDDNTHYMVYYAGRYVENHVGSNK